MCRGRHRRPPRRPPARSRRRRRQDGRRATAHRSRGGHTDHAIVVRSVCCRGSASRPPLSRSSCSESRSRICCGVSARARAAASSTARGRESRRAAQLGDRVVRLEPRALAEELHRLLLSERRHLVLDLAAHAQQLSGGDDELQVGAGVDERGKLGCCLDDLLQIVEHEQELTLTDVGGQAVLAAQHLSHLLADESGVTERRQPHPVDARLEVGHELRGRLDGKPRLAGAAGPRQGEDAGALSEQRDDLLCLPVSAHERRRGPRQVGVGDRLQGREAPLAQLVEGERLCEVLQAVGAELGQLSGDEDASRLRHEHLAAVARAHDPGRRVHVHADVLGRVEPWLARMYPYADRDRPGLQPAHRLRDGWNGLLGRGEGVEEGIALVVHLVARVGAKASLTMRRCSPRAWRYSSWPSSSSSRVEPSMSVKTSVTVPLGCSATRASCVSGALRTTTRGPRGPLVGAAEV